MEGCGTVPLQPLPLAKPGSAFPGQAVSVLGFGLFGPGAQLGPSLTHGCISKVGLLGMWSQGAWEVSRAEQEAEPVPAEHNMQMPFGQT